MPLVPSRHANRPNSPRRLEQERYVELIASQCRARGNLGAKIFEGMFAAMPSYASSAVAAVFALDHASCKEITTRYLAALLNDMTRSSGLVQEIIDGNNAHLEVENFTGVCRKILCPGVELSRVDGVWDDAGISTS